MSKSNPIIPENNPIQVADRMFMVIELLASKGSLGLMDISNELHLNKTTVHRILNSLTYMGYVVQDHNNLKYRLSFKLCSLSSQILDQIDITKIVRPYLKDLVRLTGETVHLVQIDGTEAIYIDKLESTDNSVRLVSQLGRRLPLYCSGVGKSLLADMPEEEVLDVWNNSKKELLTPKTVITLPEFLKELETVRKSGYAIDNEENEMGIRCVAASINLDGMPQYAFSVSAPTYRMDDDRLHHLADIVLDTKETITSALS